ncbi:MAG: YibE/F family protein [Arthrobacter sp.]
MGHSHHHDAGTPSRAALAARRKANRLLTLILVPLGLLAVAGLIALWPSGEPGEITIADPYATAQGVSIDTGSVQRVGIEACPSSATLTQAGVQAPQCQVAHVLPSSGGAAVAVEVPPEVAKTNAIEAGDTIRYLNLEDVMVDSGAPPYIFMDFVRSVPIAVLAVLYAGVVIAVARWRGARALIGLGGAYAVLAGFILPGLVEGKPPLLLGLVGSSVIMIGVLYFAHGFSARTSTALLGTLFGLGITAGLAAWATDAAHLIGVDNENAYTLINSSDELSISGIILCGLIVSGLGVLNDVTITQSSAVWEMYELAPGASARRLFAGAMRVGRDHIASTVYTIAFAYAGAALPVLILVSLYDRTLMETLTSGELAEEVVRTLVGSIGLVLAIPVTTGVAVLVVKAVGLSRTPGSGDGSGTDDTGADNSAESGTVAEMQTAVPAAAAGGPVAGGPAGSLPGAAPPGPGTRGGARGRRASTGLPPENQTPD